MSDRGRESFARKAVDVLVMLAAGAVVGGVIALTSPYPKWGQLGTLLVGVIGGAIGGQLLASGGLTLGLTPPVADKLALGLLGAAGVMSLARFLS